MGGDAAYRTFASCAGRRMTAGDLPECGCVEDSYNITTRRKFSALPATTSFR